MSNTEPNCKPMITVVGLQVNINLNWDVPADTSAEERARVQAWWESDDGKQHARMLALRALMLEAQAFLNAHPNSSSTTLALDNGPFELPTLLQPEGASPKE